VQYKKSGNKESDRLRRFGRIPKNLLYVGAPEKFDVLFITRIFFDVDMEQIFLVDV